MRELYMNITKNKQRTTTITMNRDNIQAVAVAASITTMIVMAIVFAMLTA